MGTEEEILPYLPTDWTRPGLVWRDKQGGETAQRSLWEKLEHLEGGPQGIPCAEGAIPWLVHPSMEKEEARDSLPVSIAVPLSDRCSLQ